MRKSETVSADNEELTECEKELLDLIVAWIIKQLIP